MSHEIRSTPLDSPWHIESGRDQRWGDNLAVCYGEGGGRYCVMHKWDNAVNRALLEHLVALHNASLTPHSEKVEKLPEERAEFKACALLVEWVEQGKRGMPDAATLDDAVTFARLAMRETPQSASAFTATEVPMDAAAMVQTMRNAERYLKLRDELCRGDRPAGYMPASIAVVSHPMDFDAAVDEGWQ